MDAAVKIKRLFLEGEPGGQRSLFWEDEHGTWLVPNQAGLNGFAMGFFDPPTIEENAPHERHPELVTVPLYDDYITQGEAHQNGEMDSIVEPVLVEAYRRLNAFWYDDLPKGNIELPVPGVWKVEPNKFPPQRIRDL